MTTQDKIKSVYDYMDKHWGQELAETLWHKSCQCTTDEELSTLADLIEK
jgi:hypothetical protein